MALSTTPSTAMFFTIIPTGRFTMLLIIISLLTLFGALLVITLISFGNLKLSRTLAAAVECVNYQYTQTDGVTFHSIQPLLAVTFKLTWRQRGHFCLLSSKAVLCRRMILISKTIPGSTLPANSVGPMTWLSLARITW